MKTKTLRRPYAAPNAELICLAPATPIANSWTWKKKGELDSSVNGKWNQNHWGTSLDIFGNASVTGIAEWGVDELDSN